jgi:hypothetical protein
MKRLDLHTGATRRTAIFGLMLAVGALPGIVCGQSNSTEFVPFNRFLGSAKAATARALMSRADSRVKDTAAFEEMRQHILTMYQDVEVAHSFVLGSVHFDCVPVTQQPAARILGIQGAPPPPQSLLAPRSTPNDTTADGSASLTAHLDVAVQLDEFGNQIGCEQDTIPMRRLNLEEMTRFPTLRDFFAKGPDSAGQAKVPGAPGHADTQDPATFLAGNPTLNHRYAIMFQNVNNLGGSSTLNVWSPNVNTTLGEAMSLSQEWYIGSAGASTQTAEVGWQVMPQLWGTKSPVLFIYWTANDYDQTDYPGIKGGGCYNLSCPGFYQTASDQMLGAPLSASTAGGAQYEFTAEYYLSGGNWWLAINGKWVGYYSGSLYHGGQMSRNSQLIEFGTETYGTASVWPPSGSGNWSSEGANFAAYQRDLFMIGLSGQSFWDSLTSYQPSPGCYTTTGPYSGTSGSVFFYAGGPGGRGC